MMNDTFVKLAALFPAAWCIWACIGAPLLLLVIGTLATIGGQSKGTTDAPAPHQHSGYWQPNYDKPVASPDGVYGVFPEKRKCDECGETEERNVGGFL